MTSAATDIEKKALRLSAKDRVELAIALWESIHSSAKPTAGEKEFAARRLAEHKASPNKTIPWAKARKILRAKGGR